MKLLQKRFFKSFFVSLFLIQFIFASTYQANGDQRSISSLTELKDKKLFLGDVIELQTGVCWDSKKPKRKLSKTRLQIFINDNWRSVGRTKFRSDTQCSGNSKKIYEQVFIWEVDRLGEVDSRRKYLGTLQIRNSAISPSEYVKVTILESYEKLKEYEASQSLEFFDWMNCMNNRGQWDENRGICIGGNRP